MANRDPLHQPPTGEGGLVFSAKPWQTPLLPYERQLIELIGCTEDEYRKLEAEARRRGRLQPAGYEYIPDVQMGPALVPALISLAIGIATSAISYLLAPKPKAPSAGGRTRDLGSITGQNRFAPTFGFDSQAELASYGDPIPIIFGKYEPVHATGGILYTPKLVWSRMFSYGSQQGVKLLFVVGEQGRDPGTGDPPGITPPDLPGIFLGNGPLNSAQETNYAFYWKRNSTRSPITRVRAVNYRYGTRGTRASGDPENNDDIFLCPTAISTNDTGFSSAHSLSNNADFGCFAPIPNGTAHRVNWRVISIVRTSGDNAWNDDRDYVQTRERRKIAGDRNGTVSMGEGGEWRLGMEGIGRNYSRRMGITSIRRTGGAVVTVPNSEGIREELVNEGDIITFTISSAQIPAGFYDYTDPSTGRVRDNNVTVEDINSELNEQRIAADDALQIGETFMISKTVWQVTGRSLAQWTPESRRDQQITLRCTEVIGSQRIGLVSEAMLTRNYLSDDNGLTNNLYAGINFYPLMRVNFGIVRNTRACDVTEIGIKSRVYQRLNGLCNFQTLPSPARLRQADQDRIALTSGTNTSFIRRASSFLVYVRPAGADSNGFAYPWSWIDVRFVIVGNSPVDQYNFIRFKHPDTRQYEYRFVPKNGADINNTANNATYWLINANNAVDDGSERRLLAETVYTAYGNFVVSAVGRQVSREDIRYNVEFSTGGRITTGGEETTFPSTVGIESFLPDVDTATSTVAAVAAISPYSNPSAITQGRYPAFFYEIFRSADSDGVPENGTRTTYPLREVLPDGRWVTLVYTARKYRLPTGHYSGQTFAYRVIDVQVTGSGGNFNFLQNFVVKRQINGDNPFRNVPSEGTLTEAGIYMQVLTVNNSGGTTGRAQSVWWEIFGPAINFPVGTRRTVEIDLTSGPKRLRIALSAAVFATSTTTNPAGYDRLWDSRTVQCLPVTATYTTQNWQTGDTADKTYTVSANNPFYRAGASIGIRLGVFSIATARTGTTELSAERTFESRSQYGDVSHYSSFVEKSNQTAPEHTISYVNEMVSNEIIPDYDRMTLCGLALKAARNFTSLDQLRIWVSAGLHVRRFHPSDSPAVGPSNLFCDLVHYLLASGVAGVGSALNITLDTSSRLINTADLAITARFLRENRLFFDGVIGDAVNVRQFISETAPNFLCNFVISDGRFSLVPAVPTNVAGEISTAAVQIKQLFTSGNIIEDSFEVEYLAAEERKQFQAVVRYREEKRNQLPQERNVSVRWADSPEFVPVESFDLTAFCTSSHHAELVGRFFLSIRKRITHTVRFRTLPYGMDLAPGDYIRVATEASPYSSARNGAISATGVITSVTPIADGQYSILYYRPGLEDVTPATMTVSDGRVSTSALQGSLFTIVEATTSQNVYMVEQLTLDEDGTVVIAASEFPCDEQLTSLIAQDLIASNRNRFVFDV